MESVDTTKHTLPTNSTESYTDPVVLVGGFLSNQQREQIQYVIIWITQVLNFSALVANSLNIAVFTRLGFAESSNVSLLALSICDLTATIFTVWTCISGSPELRGLNLPFDAENTAMLISGGPWTFVVRCAAWVTVFISFERCLCILMPLKVKQLINSKTTTIAVIIIAIVTITPVIGMFWRWKFVWVFHPLYNRTILTLSVVEERHVALMEYVIHVLYGPVLIFLAFGIVTACTIFLVVHLRLNSQWRRSASSGKPVDNVDSETKTSTSSKPAAKERMSNKEERLVRLVASIATIFIICYTPTALLTLCMGFFKEFSLFGQYENTFKVVYLSGSMFQSLSASLNIFIYYSMGSRFRNTFRQMLGIDKKKM